MSQVSQIQFQDKMISFATFMDAIRNVVREEVSNIVGVSDTMSQRQAYSKYGQARVNHWKQKGLLHPSKTRGKVLYKLSELETCKLRIQDYL